MHDSEGGRSSRRREHVGAVPLIFLVHQSDLVLGLVRPVMHHGRSVT